MQKFESRCSHETCSTSSSHHCEHVLLHVFLLGEKFGLIGIELFAIRIIIQVNGWKDIKDWVGKC